MEFIKRHTPNEDTLLLAGTTQKDIWNRSEELDGFVIKLVPPALSHVTYVTTASNIEDNVKQSKSTHPMKPINFTMERDETRTMKGF